MNLARLAPLAVVLALVGCASADSTSQPSDDLTPDELAAGAQPNASADDESDDPAAEAAAVPADPITSAAEDSTPFLDPEDQATSHPQILVPEEELDADDQSALKSCHRATGYRSGHAFTLCITYVDGKPVEVNTARAYLRMRAAAKRRGVHLYVVSGFRTMAQQRYLYHLYKIGKGNLAAVPGYSNHQSGHALDLDTSAHGVYSYLASHGHSFGFRRTVPSEAWHWEHW
jgi:LAS superfamily LD-carboxypeptidase LdcB